MTAPQTPACQSDSNAVSVGCDALLCFLREKLADAEKSLTAREQMANSKPISEEEWEQLKSMPGVRVTKGRKLSKAEVRDIEEGPKRHGRIAAKCRHEVEMFRAVIAALDKHNTEITSREATPPKP